MPIIKDTRLSQTAKSRRKCRFRDSMSDDGMDSKSARHDSANLENWKEVLLRQLQCNLRPSWHRIGHQSDSSGGGRDTTDNQWQYTSSLPNQGTVLTAKLTVQSRVGAKRNKNRMVSMWRGEPSPSSSLAFR